MKKIILLIFTLSLYQASAQVSTFPNSIGIGNGTLTSIPLHIYKDGEVTRLQGASPFLSFYNGANFSGYFQAIGSTLEVGTKNNYNLNVFTGDLLRINVDGSTGQTTFSQRINAGAGINNVGAMRMAGNAGNLGDVLMSLGNGTPAWSSISQNPQIGFQATLPSSFTVPFGSNTNIAGFTEIFDDGNNFANLAGEFTAPSGGLYHFEYKMSIAKLAGNPDISNGTILIRLTINGFLTRQTNFEFNDFGGTLFPKMVFESLKLNQNDIVKFQVYQENNTGNAVRIFANGGGISDPIFSCYKVY
jgi:hypothetical protein